MDNKNKFDFKIIIIILLIIIIFGIVIYYNSKNNSDKLDDSHDYTLSDEDEAIELVNKWLSAQKNKNINKLLTITDPIGTEALIRSFYKKGNTYRIKDFDDNYYIVKKEYNNNAEKNDYNSVDDYIKEQFNSLYTQITYTNFKINKLENLSKVSETNNIYTIDFKAKITYNISQNDNEVSISLKGPLYLIKKDGKFRILGTYDDLTSLSELY